jgi:flagellar hook-associated protein 2
MSTISATGTVSFSGLASGIDTDSIIESLIEVESAPKALLEDKVEYLETKQETYENFNELLDGFYNAVLGLNSENDVKSFAISNAGSDYFSLSTTSLASEGSSSVEVISLAQQQKDISTNYVEDTETTTLSGELQIGEESFSYEGITLDDLASQINGGEYGVTASLVNDGSGNGYRLMLTAETAGEEIDIVATGDILLDTTSDGHTVAGTRAEVQIDGVTYYSSSNTFTAAIKGTTLTLLEVSNGKSSKVSIASDADTVIATQFQEMVDAYNAINEFVETIRESDPTLANTMKSVQRNLKSSLTSNDLINLGIETDWETGELTFDTDVFNAAYEEDAEGIVTSLFGDEDSDGIMTRLDEYMTDLMSSSEGFLATKEEKIDEEISRLEDSITAMEARLEKRQELLEAQFAAMEELISSLNSTGDYITNFFESYNASS